MMVLSHPIVFSTWDVKSKKKKKSVVFLVNNF